jgi:hypothetical protein
VCVVYLQARGILPYGPASVNVFDFDERICITLAVDAGWTGTSTPDAP